jgi:hypothetical protein
MSVTSTGLSRDERRGRTRPTKLPGAYRTRHEAAEHLQSRGYPISFSTLTKLCALGEGPEPAAWWGSRPLYTDPILDAWAEARCRRGRSPRAPPLESAEVAPSASETPASVGAPAPQPRRRKVHQSRTPRHEERPAGEGRAGERCAVKIERRQGGG